MRHAGGAEHAVLHLLYARFWHKVLYDIGVVTEKEPFQSLVSQGMILGEVSSAPVPDPTQYVRACLGSCTYFAIACTLHAGLTSLHLQVEYTVYRDQDGNPVDEDHPSATACR